MTHSGGKPHAVGDRGQRYEVRYFDVGDWDDEREPCVLGWTDTLESAKRMVGAISRHPTWCDGEIHDRHHPSCKATDHDADGKGQTE